MEPPLLMPITDPEEAKNQATFIDRYGDIVALPNNILVAFARLAARESIRRIKRYHIMNVFRPRCDFCYHLFFSLAKFQSNGRDSFFFPFCSPVAGHPKFTKAALFDIISPDLEHGPLAAGAELIAVANDVLESFPTLSQNYDIHISHSKS